METNESIVKITPSERKRTHREGFIKAIAVLGCVLASHGPEMSYRKPEHQHMYQLAKEALDLLSR